MNITKSLIIIFCILIANLVYGQSDYNDGFIITNDNDTIWGLIKLQDRIKNGEKCVFKIDSNSEIKKFSPSEILGYRYLDGKYFVSETISYPSNYNEVNTKNNIVFDRANDTYYSIERIDHGIKSENRNDNRASLITKNVFLEFLIKGNINVYAFIDSIANPLYFIKKEDSLIYLKSSTELLYNQWEDDYINEKKEYIGLLNYLLRDCEGIQKKVSSTNLNNESLIKLAKYYHEGTCNNLEDKCIIYEKTNRRLHVSVIPMIYYSKLKVSESSLYKSLNYDFINQQNMSYGVKFKFSNFQYLSPRLFSQVGIIFHSQNLISKDIDTKVEFGVLETPIEFNYYILLHSKLRPFLGISINPNFRFQKELTSYGSSVSKQFKEAKTIYITLSGKAGLDYYLSDNIFFRTAIQFKHGGSFYNDVYHTDNSQSNAIEFLLGFGYRINK